MTDSSLPERDSAGGEAKLGRYGRERDIPGSVRPLPPARSESDAEAHPGYYGNGMLTRPQIDYLAWLFTDGLYKPSD